MFTGFVGALCTEGKKEMIGKGRDKHNCPLEMLAALLHFQDLLIETVTHCFLQPLLKACAVSSPIFF